MDHLTPQQILTNTKAQYLNKNSNEDDISPISPISLTNSNDEQYGKEEFEEYQESLYPSI